MTAEKTKTSSGTDITNSIIPNKYNISNLPSDFSNIDCKARVQMQVPG